MHTEYRFLNSFNFLYNNDIKYLQKCDLDRTLISCCFYCFQREKTEQIRQNQNIISFFLSFLYCIKTKFCYHKQLFSKLLFSHIQGRLP